ncbi:ABC transporter substrate-binding protein [Garicola koreensis]|uniref:Multiple sugar transport system substrate-binding protein n=1 Tax=Garicola koreensis TaxID=1262554 RepID=A0A7W5TVK5_9MICC|nr:sugar ABC transporter substrate-binding protein [Garicola koreensis]MBB3668084.1 multiple sugar transport system substrate-binding protein [Garicola koreensis]
MNTPPPAHHNRRSMGIQITSAAAVVTLLATSCGSAAADSTEGDAFAGDYEGESLELLMNVSHEGAGEWLSERFEAETGVEVTITTVPYDEIASQLSLDQQSGANVYDVAAPWYVSLGDLAADGSIQPITELVESSENIDVDDFIPSIWEPYSHVDDEIYGLPFDGDIHALFYNTEILERNGFDEPPTTWDEYAEQVQTITENESADGVYGAAVFGQQSPVILGASFANRLAGFGGDFLNEDGQPVINSEEAVASLEALEEVWDDALPTPAETDFGAGNSAWFAGNVAFIENWTDLGVRSQAPASGSEVTDSWGVTYLPRENSDDEPRASLVAGYSWTVTGNTDQTHLAREFIEWAASSEVNAELLTALPPTGIDPNRISSLEDETYGTSFPKLQEVNSTTLNGALAWPTGQNATEAAQILTDELAAYLSGQRSSAQDALDTVQAEWEQLLGG